MEIENQQEYNLVKSVDDNPIFSATIPEDSQDAYQAYNIYCDGKICEEIEDEQTMDTENDCEEISSHSYTPEEQPPLSIKPFLPMKTRRTHRQTLVLDLDETLVHSELKPNSTTNLIVNFLYHEKPCSIYVSFRPGLFRFLEAVSQRFEVVLFTASQKCYAEQLLMSIDPDMKLIKYRFYRESCELSDGGFIKDLRKLGRDLREVIIVDNTLQAFSLQPDNGIPIVSWYNDLSDQELDRTLAILDELQGVTDVRPMLNQKYNMLN